MAESKAYRFLHPTDLYREQHPDIISADNWYGSKFRGQFEEFVRQAVGESDAKLDIDAWAQHSGLTPEQIKNLRQYIRVRVAPTSDLGLTYAFNSGAFKQALADAAAGYQADVSTDAARTAEEEAARSEQEKAAALEKKRSDITGQIQAFIDTMTGPSRPDDPVRVALLRAGTDAAQAAAGLSGVRGGLAGTAAASMAQANLLPYELQRAQLRGQGLSALDQHSRGLEALDADRKRLQLSAEDMYFNQAQTLQKREDMLAQERWKASQGASQGIGAAIGTGLGALGFIGGPALGAATMSAGGALGGALGGMAAPSSPSYQPTKYYKGVGGSAGKTGTGF